MLICQGRVRSKLQSFKRKRADGQSSQSCNGDVVEQIFGIHNSTSRGDAQRAIGRSTDQTGSRGEVGVVDGDL